MKLTAHRPRLVGWVTAMAVTAGLALAAAPSVQAAAACSSTVSSTLGSTACPSTARSSNSPAMGAASSLPSTFKWSTSGILISPKSDSKHNIISVKDPSVVYYNGRWYVYMSTVNSSGAYGMATINFTDWSQAAAAPFTYLNNTAIGDGYKTAPMLFYFAPKKLWYLTYQAGGNLDYSTNSNIANPAGWNAPHGFYSSGMPSVIKAHIGGGYWVDSWVICDTANCYLFSADDNGYIYRSTSSISQFPTGFGNGSNTVIAASASNPHDMFEADNVYKVAGTNTYLLVVEAIGTGGRRLFHSWTSTSLAGSWTPLAATNNNPFLGASNVTFPSGTSVWTQDFSSGEAIRSNYDQTVTLSPCHLQYVYQGYAPGSPQSYSHLPWRIGMATQTNSTC